MAANKGNDLLIFLGIDDPVGATGVHGCLTPPAAPPPPRACAAASAIAEHERRGAAAARSGRARALSRRIV